MKKLTVLGCGATGMAATRYFTDRGVQVCLCDVPEHTAHLDEIRSAGGIRLTGVGRTEDAVFPFCSTTDFAAAMKHADRVLLCASAARQRKLAEQCAAHVTPEHSFLISPGNFGSPELRRILGVQAQIGELCDNLWPCRISGPGEVLLGLPLGSKWAAAFPASDTPALIERWADLLELLPGANVLETALNSPNVISHVAGAVLNTAAIERAAPDFAFFRDGLSPAVIRVLEAAEQERDLVLDRLGLRIYKKVGPLLNSLQTEAPPGFEVFRGLDGPAGMSHRYITEDAQCGVALLISLARAYDIPVPVTQAALTLAECINEADYYHAGRTLERYGLVALPPEKLLSML